MVPCCSLAPLLSSWRSLYFLQSRSIMNTLSFCLFWEVLLSPSFLKDIIPYTIFLVDSFLGFFFSPVLSIPFLCALNDFHWEICWESYRSFLVCDMSPFSGCFQCCFFVFEILIIICFNVNLSLFIWLEVFELLERVSSFLSSVLRSFQSVFFSNFSC